ncbi:hypothetical protein HPB50_027175 [Hyalomma asiaticum]|uniref:Uncharacterized protein n=1 Tax=Hyalomma asiaticum TaxID=266040 RepID=A0ACB7RUG4_HYAAI|nr:hypothetical protein HPB50_027175 [Hyalomma asiaticum]
MPRRKKRASTKKASECEPKGAGEDNHIEELDFPGDQLDTLISAVDTVVLCMDVLLDCERTRVPDGCTVSPERRRVYTDPKTLVARKEALANLGVSGAVFAGCAAFSSSKLYRRAAMTVLAAARTLCIIHNRDSVCKLASWFPTVTELALPHNLAFRGSSLERITGDAPALGSTNLELDELLLSECLLKLPKIASVQSALDAVLHMWDVPSDDGLLNGLDSAYLRKCPEAIMGSWRELPGMVPSYRDVGVAEIESAGRFCPALRKLEVVFEKKEALSAFVDYKHLTSLSLTFVGKGKCHAKEAGLSTVIKMSVNLERLHLQFFSCVDLREITEHCLKLTNLSLHTCTLVPITDSGATLLPKHLGSIHIGLPILPSEHSGTFLSLLKGNCETVRELRLEGDEACQVFLKLCCETQFPSLQRLTLDTSSPIREVGFLPEKLHDVVRNMPALKFLTTDSYDLRLFFEYYVPSVMISWCVCTICITERSRLHLGET